jgi:homogentisate 1,2-dioxygenase
LIDLQPDLQLKSSNTITSSKINCIGYIPSNQKRNISHTRKPHHHHHHHPHKHEFISKEQTKNLDSLLDIDSSDDDLEQENISLSQFSINSSEKNFSHEDEDTIWLGTQNGE